MNLFSFLLTTFVAFVLASHTVSPPNTVTLIHPDPKVAVPLDSSLTFGFEEPSEVLYGLIENVTTWFQQPDGSIVPAFTLGTPYTWPDGSFNFNTYTPQQCRTYPGAQSLYKLNATQSGIYTFFWNVTYLMSADSKRANSTYCGPSPFTVQSWVLNSTVDVLNANIGTAVVESTSTATTHLASNPTGKVINSAAHHVANFKSVLAVLGMGIGMLI